MLQIKIAGLQLKIWSFYPALHTVKYIIKLSPTTFINISVCNKDIYLSFMLNVFAHLQQHLEVQSFINYATGDYRVSTCHLTGRL
jgi:hypothetical protein